MKSSPSRIHRHPTADRDALSFEHVAAGDVLFELGVVLCAFLAIALSAGVLLRIG